MPYDLLKPENCLPRDIKKIAAELVNEIETVINKSVKKMNSVIDERSEIAAAYATHTRA